MIIDHRAEAENKLDLAGRGNVGAIRGIRLALLGIGHAILAGPPPARPVVQFHGNGWPAFTHDSPTVEVDLQPQPDIPTPGRRP